MVCAAHTHSVYGRAYCALGKGLEYVSLESCMFYDDHVLFEGKGIVLAEDEGRDIAEALGGRKAALLRNHGILTVGRSIEEAVSWFYLLDKVGRLGWRMVMEGADDVWIVLSCSTSGGCGC